MTKCMKWNIIFQLVIVMQCFAKGTVNIISPLAISLWPVEQYSTMSGAMRTYFLISNLPYNALQIVENSL